MSQGKLSFKDKSGRSVNVGDYIVYGHAMGRCAGLRYGKVLGIAPREKNHARDNDSKLRVIGIDDDWWNQKPDFLSRPSYVHFPGRVLLVGRHQISDEILDLLDCWGEERL